MGIHSPFAQAAGGRLTFMKSMYVGIDIGKAALDVAAPGLSLRVQNNASGFRTLLQQSCALSSAPHFICESSS